MASQPITVDFDDAPPTVEAVNGHESFESARPVDLKEVRKNEGGPPSVYGRPRTDSPAGAKQGTRLRGEVGELRAVDTDDSERNLLGCIFVDGSVITACQSAGITPIHFDSPQHRAIYATAERLHGQGHPVDQAIVAQELIGHEAFSGRNLFLDIAAAADSSATTAQAPYFITKVREGYLRRSAIRRAKAALELATDPNADLSALEAASGVTATAARLQSRGLFDFSYPNPKDPSILLGNRFLSRGDGAILASTSGMGKSSLSIQMATCWALGRPFHDGLPPNGPLRSLIIQSEDSDGDIAEVQMSMAAGYNLTDPERVQVNDRVRIVTDRIHRGPTFIRELRRQIDLHRPDIVWINPLLAFIGGDVNDAEAVGEFLREGVNSTNEPPRHAFILIHHTSKPPKEAKERRWNEVMYDMAGSADLTNWARAMISLRPRETEGEFDLVLAKRGVRAGFTTPSPSGAQRVPTTTVPLRHARAKIETPAGGEIPLIFWERFEGSAATPDKGGRPPRHDIQDMLKFFPKFDEPFKEANQIHRHLGTIFPVSGPAFKDLCIRAEKEGLLAQGQTPQGGYGYRVAG